MHTAYRTPHTVPCILYTAHCILYTSPFTPHTRHNPVVHLLKAPDLRQVSVSSSLMTTLLVMPTV